MSEVIQSRKRRFARLPVMQALKAVTCGFELETQRVDGKSFDQLKEETEGKFDQRRWDETVASGVKQFMDKTQGLFAGFVLTEQGNPYYLHAFELYKSNAMGKQIIKLFKTYREKKTGGESPAMTEAQWKTHFEDDLISLNQMAKACEFNLAPLAELVKGAIADTLSRDDYTSYDDGDELAMDLPEGVAAKRDGSVQGPEFIIAGKGTSAVNFSRALKGLLTKYEMKVDTGCSFHIHISVPGIKHTYGEALQMAMYEYLLQNIHRVPECVQERWRKDVNYFKPILSKDKYSFVHFHRQCGTWEFRCFGNVNTSKDGMACLKLAVEALQYAYAVQLGEKQALFTDPKEWSDEIFDKVMKMTKARKKEALVTIAKANRKKRASENAIAA